MEIVKRDNVELFQMMISIAAHCSQVEMEIEKRYKAEMIQMVITIGVHWRSRLRRETMQS